MKIDEPNFETLEEAQQAVKKAFADFVGYYVYKGEGHNAFERARTMIGDQCFLAKEQILKREKL